MKRWSLDNRLITILTFLFGFFIPLERHIVSCSVDVLYHSREIGSAHSHISRRNHSYSIFVEAVQNSLSNIQSSQNLKKFHHNQGNLSVVIVSAFWMLNTTKYTENLNDSLNLYVSWMENSTRLHAPYVFFRGKKESSLMSIVRPDSEFSTLWMDLEFEHLPFAKFSAIRDVSKIWLSKIDLLVQAFQILPTSVQWFLWADAGMNEYRFMPPPRGPWPGREFGVSYPTQKFVYAQSRTKDDCLPRGKNLMAGTVFAIHRLALIQAQELFHATLSDCLHRAGSNPKLIYCCSDDQIIFYMMSLRQPQLFFAHNGEFPNDWAGIIKSHF